MDLATRFWAKVDRRGPDECWPWLAVTNHGGYGMVSVDNVMRRAHRVAWELVNGPIPEGIKVLHRCDVRACCNPGHLFLGTQRANIDDMVAKGRGRTKAPACKYGHPAEGNRYPSGPCRPCAVRRKREYREGAKRQHH